MKYLIFACHSMYPSGGMGDYRVSRDTKVDAEAYIEELKADSDYSFAQILCLDEKEVIQYNFGPRAKEADVFKLTEQGVVKK